MYTAPQPRIATARAVAGTRTRTACGMCNGTLGELFQGPVAYQGTDCIGLVSFPVDRYAWAYFTEGDGEKEPLPALPKAAESVRLFLHRYGLQLPPGRWSRHTELDVGVGMASSTADIVATLRCLFQVFDLSYSPPAVLDILSHIERADSVFLDEYALYLSDRHRVVERLGTSMSFYTCFVTEPGTVDTASATPALMHHYDGRRDAYRTNLEDMLLAFRLADIAGVARAATRSAALSQEVLPKISYDSVVDNRAHFGADGVFVAHTGSIIGYLFAWRPTRHLMDELSAFFRGLGYQCSFARAGYGRS